MKGILGNINPNLASALQGIGMGLSQIDAGQPVNLSPAYAALQQRQQMANHKRMLEQSGVMSRFDADQRAILAQMPPEAAMRIIAAEAFRRPEPVKGIEVGGNVVNPYDGTVIYEGPQEPQKRNIIKGADGFNYYEDTRERVLPDVTIAPEGWRTLSKEEVEEKGLPPGKVWQEGLSGANRGKIVSTDGMSVNIDMGGEPGRYIYAEDAGLPKGWRFDTQTQTAERIPGGPEDIEAQTAEEKVKERDRQGKAKLGTTLTSINLNLDTLDRQGSLLDFDLPVTGAVGDMRRTGLGQLLTGSEAVDFGNRTNQVTDSAALAEIQNMRNNNPTGGAVGQLTDSERIAIGNAVTALNSSTSAEEYARAARAYRKLALDIALKGPDGKVLPYEVDEYGNVIVNGEVWFEMDPGGVEYGPEKKDRAAQGAKKSTDFSNMSANELLEIDVMKLTPEQQDAWEERMDELGM